MFVSVDGTHPAVVVTETKLQPDQLWSSRRLSDRISLSPSGYCFMKIEHGSLWRLPPSCGAEISVFVVVPNNRAPGCQQLLHPV